MAYWEVFPRYISVAERQAKAKKEMEKLRKQGREIQPVAIEGRTIACSFWGKGWCQHLESFSDYDNRLPRGRSYVRNGSVCHLEIKAGLIEAMVCGSSLYKIKIKIDPLGKTEWEAVKNKCRGQIGSLLELLQGRLSDKVMAVVSDREHGLFPHPGEIDLNCSCPDWADMCKHLAAVLYGVGSRLDRQPELLFILRGVDAAELIAAEVALPVAAGAGEDALEESGLAELFGIDLDVAPAREKPEPTKKSDRAAAKPVKPARKAGLAKNATPAKPPKKVVPAKKARPVRAAVKKIATAAKSAAKKTAAPVARLTLAEITRQLDAMNTRVAKKPKRTVRK